MRRTPRRVEKGGWATVPGSDTTKLRGGWHRQRELAEPEVIMALPAQFSLLHSDLNDFLFAAVGEQQNGMPLNVVSGLTGLGLDPWEEAARLAALPRARAAETFAPIIARLPFDRSQSSDDLTISRQLVELLPEQQRAASTGHEPADAKGNRRYCQAMILLACLALAMAVLSALL